MGTDDFAEKIFHKVFTDDVNRLRGMGDMWKSRKPPEPLSYEALHKQAKEIESTIPSDDQKVWTLVEDFAVFQDR